MSRSLMLALALVLFSSGARAQCQGSATYRVVNTCLWNSRTHPTDYPSNAHFSPMCGGVHNSAYDLFSLGGMSTPGVQSVAETGDCGLLEGEIDECVMYGNCAPDGYFSWKCDTSANAEGVGNGVCMHTGMITATWEYPYVSLISMIAPSPDWFVGASSVNLCQKDTMTGEYYWVDQYPMGGSRSLNAYDAGTDSGPTFLSLNSPTSPHEPITRFDARDASNIFYNQEEGVLNPLCRLALERV